MARTTIDTMVRRGISGDDDDDARLIRLECLTDCEVMKTLFVLPGLVWPGPRLPWECKICSI